MNYDRKRDILIGAIIFGGIGSLFITVMMAAAIYNLTAVFTTNESAQLFWGLLGGTVSGILVFRHAFFGVVNFLKESGHE
jgi:hypothetical protein